MGSESKHTVELTDKEVASLAHTRMARDNVQRTEAVMYRGFGHRAGDTRPAQVFTDTTFPGRVDAVVGDIHAPAANSVSITIPSSPYNLSAVLLPHQVYTLVAMLLEAVEWLDGMDEAGTRTEEKEEKKEKKGD